MTARVLPQHVSPALLKSLSPREFLLVCATFGLEQTTRRLMLGSTDDDDLAAYQIIVDRIQQAEAARQNAAQK